MKTRSFLSVVSQLLGCAAFVWLVVREFLVSPQSLQGMDIHSVLVGILGSIITLLVGWNIYSALDFKSLRLSIGKELNKAHNYIDDLRGDTYAFLSQQGCALLSLDSKGSIKYQTLTMGLHALKIYSMFPDKCSFVKGNAIISSLIDTLKITEDIKLTRDEVDDLILVCGSVKNRDSYEEFAEFFNIIKNSEV